MDSTLRSALETTRDLTADLAQHPQAGDFGERLSAWHRLAAAALEFTDEHHAGVVLRLEQQPLHLRHAEVIYVHWRCKAVEDNRERPVPPARGANGVA
jgi:hypothetical protein